MYNAPAVALCLINLTLWKFRMVNRSILAIFVEGQLLSNISIRCVLTFEQANRSMGIKLNNTTWLHFLYTRLAASDGFN